MSCVTHEREQAAFGGRVGAEIRLAAVDVEAARHGNRSGCEWQPRTRKSALEDGAVVDPLLEIGAPAGLEGHQLTVLAGVEAGLDQLSRRPVSSWPLRASEPT